MGRVGGSRNAFTIIIIHKFAGPSAQGVLDPELIWFEGVHPSLYPALDNPPIAWCLYFEAEGQEVASSFFFEYSCSQSQQPQVATGGGHPSNDCNALQESKPPRLEYSSRVYGVCGVRGVCEVNGFVGFCGECRLP